MEKKKKKKKEKMMMMMNFTLPYELIFEILLRLPARSLVRFKSVCKSWLSLISDPQFAKSQFDLNAAPTHRLLLRVLNDKVESLDLDSSLENASAVVTLNAPPPSKVPPLYMSCNYRPLYFFGSCRGFMLLAYKHTSDFILWNPTTNFHRRIQNLESGFMFGFLCGFGYDNSTDDYVVVFVTMFRFRNNLPQTEIHSFSLKTESWCDTQYVNVHYINYRHDLVGAEPGVCLNDSLHWLVTCKDTDLPVVIGFDLGKKSLSDIPLSSELAAELAWKVYSLRELGGCLSLCSAGASGESERAEIWVMKEYRVQSSWTKAFVITFCDIPCRHFYPICFIQGGGVVGSNGNGRLMKFSAKGKLLEHLKYGGEHKHPQKYFEMYRESLILFPGEQRLRK